ncbi:MAG: asparagine synthase-related protein [Pseudonocardia sp.]
MADFLLPYVSAPPCMVAFSGGRDSSVVLAAAVSAARREGLPLPIPVTLSYPGVPEVDEAEWQRLVLEHLGISERVVLAVGDENDLLGPLATRLLEQHGPFWPSNVAPTWRLMDLARGGTLLTGEGGDEVFGLKRITALTRIIRAGGRAPFWIYPHAVRAVCPSAVRRRFVERHPYRRHWMRPEAEAVILRRDAEDAAAFSLHAGRNAWQFAARRSARLAYDTFRILGLEIGVTFVPVFGEPDVVASIARASGFWGWAGRTTTMLAMYGDLLPEQVLRRTSKAEFSRAVFNEHTREFARNWDGSGVDLELVDPDVLREEWLSESPAGPTMTLLHQAWCAGRSSSQEIR